MSQSSAARAMTRPAARPATRPARQPAPPRLRVVSAPAGTRLRAGVLGSASILVTGLVALLLVNISLGKGSYELYLLEAKKAELAEQRQALQEQLERESAPQRLADRARGLGMVPAPRAAFVRLSDGRVVGRPTPAGDGEGR